MVNRSSEGLNSYPRNKNTPPLKKYEKTLSTHTKEKESINMQPLVLEDFTQDYIQKEKEKKKNYRLDRNAHL